MQPSLTSLINEKAEHQTPDSHTLTSFISPERARIGGDPSSIYTDMKSSRSFSFLLLLPFGSQAFMLGVPKTAFRSRTSTLFSSGSSSREGDTPHVVNVLMVECGFGNDSHGQNATKAAKRACRNAIEFNSLSIKKMVPGGYEAMKLNVILAVPKKYQDTLDLEDIATTFPY